MIDVNVSSFKEYKVKLLELIQSGNSIGVHRLLKVAPETDYRHYKFKMINKQGEEIFVSAIALAVNLGDYAMLDSLLNNLTKIKVDEGIEAKMSGP